LGEIPPNSVTRLGEIPPNSVTRLGEIPQNSMRKLGEVPICLGKNTYSKQRDQIEKNSAVWGKIFKTV
jgi:hypothetical protein